MTKKSDLDPKEWHDLIAFACIGASYKYSTRAIDSLGNILGGLRELAAAHNFLMEAIVKYGKYELLTDVIIELQHAEKSLLRGDINVSSKLEEVVRRANQILDKQVSAKEASAMRAFTYELAFEIANAAGDGMFSTGAKISRAEKEFLQELKQLLLRN